MSNERPRALITGASLGLGRAFARECASRGMDLLLVALPGSGLPELAGAIAEEQGVEADWLEADLTERQTAGRLLEMIRGKGRGLDLLVNNAGIGALGRFKDSALEEHEATIQVNALALVRLTRLLLGEIGRRGRGYILNVASLGAFFPMPNLPIYSATKSFVLQFSLALRAELRDSIGVSVLCPNAIRAAGAVDDYVEGLNPLARCACLRPEKIAREGLDGLVRDQAVIIPGILNRALAALGRVVPRSLAMWTISHYWGGFDEERRTDMEAPAKSESAVGMAKLSGL